MVLVVSVLVVVVVVVVVIVIVVAVGKSSKKVKQAQGSKVCRIGAFNTRCAGCRVKIMLGTSSKSTGEPWYGKRKCARLRFN